MFRGILSIAFALFLLAIVMELHKAGTGTTERAMWDVAFVALAAMMYTTFNGFSALRSAQGDRPQYSSLLLALLPLLVVVYSIAVWQYSHLTTFQVISMIFGGLAAMADITLFSWLSFGLLTGAASRRHA